MPDSTLPVELQLADPVMGIDCGGSGTRIAVVAGGRVVDRYDAAPLNALLNGDAAQQLAALVRARPVVAAGIGLPGIRTAAGATLLERAVSGAVGLPVTVRSDVAMAQCGAFAGGPGVVVVAGTGSAAFGSDRHGGMAWAGGHGFLLGDEGSAYWIARQALRVALRAADGLGPPTSLAVELTQASGAGLEELVAQVHRAPAERGVLARLAPVVAASSAPEAHVILRAAGRALGELADAIVARLGPLPVVGLGGVFAAEPVAAAFAEGRVISRARFCPEVGAAIAALTAWKVHG